MRTDAFNTKTEKTSLYYLGIIAGACLLYTVSAGVRSVYGIMLSAISEQAGIPYASVSFSIAVGQLIFGVAQPAFGVIAIKRTNKYVLVLGSLMMAVGLAAIPFCSTVWMLTLFLGVLLPTGTGALAYGLIVSAVTPVLGEKRATIASGFINASSGVGSIVFSPVMQHGLESIGLNATMISLAALSALLAPVSVLICGRERRRAPARSGTERKVLPAVGKAMRDKNYWFLLISFFTCGFHMAIILTHMYSQFVSYGIAESTAAMAFSVYGFASAVGSLLSGVLCDKMPMKWVAGMLYGSRVLWIVLFLLLPKSVLSVVAFSVLVGLTGSATVPPTAGLVGKLFGAENMAVLFGVTSVSHQIGGFFSAWLGGILIESGGGYTVVWLSSAVLALGAAVITLCIQEKSRGKREPDMR